MKRLALLHHLCAASLIGLILLCLAWELWLAPLRPGGSWLVLKTLPLLAPLFGILRERRYTYQWAAMLVLAYFAEGLTRAWTDRGTGANLAIAEAALALVFFVSASLYARISVPTARPGKKT